MNVVDSAKAHVKQVVGKVTEAATSDSKIQAVTIGRPRPDVVALFRDAGQLSRIFGDIAEVTRVGSDRMRWTFVLGDRDGPSWDCVVCVENETQLRFVDVNPELSAGVVLTFRDAPQDRGTEVIARVSSPAPGVFTGALLFKALYRARALLVTGEIPTIKYNPSARDSDR